MPNRSPQELLNKLRSYFSQTTVARSAYGKEMLEALEKVEDGQFEPLDPAAWPTVKSKWLADLRSGAYRQGREALKNCYQQYCCLGVLATQFPEHFRGDCWKNASFASLVHFDQEKEIPDILPKDCQEMCMSLNDRKEADFLEIADFVECYF